MRTARPNASSRLALGHMAPHATRHGTLVVSLDLELYWGVRDRRSIEGYRENLDAVRQVVPELLALFEAFGVHATWAAVGLLLARDVADATANAPAEEPGYTDANLCPFRYMRGGIGPGVAAVHFAPELVERILGAPGQELGTHTYSHFYCLEAPRSLAAFRADLEAARAFMKSRFGVAPTSLVFPRNQYSPDHIDVARQVGITAYRGNPENWMYAPRAKGDESLLRKGARLADAFVPLSRATSVAPGSLGIRPPFNIGASRFFRPWSPAFRQAEPYRLARIEREMVVAAQRGRLYHLWWHPHNFGRHLPENLASLRRVLEAFARLRDEHSMTSESMAEVARAREGDTWSTSRAAS